MTYEPRREALTLAREIAPSGDIETLIAHAAKIEAYLTGDQPTPDGRGSSVDYTPLEDLSTDRLSAGIDFSAKLQAGPKPTGTIEWSGVAQDVVRLFNSGSTLVSHTRQCGMSTLLCNYAAAQLNAGMSVLFFAPNGAGLKDCRRRIQEYAPQAGKDQFTCVALNAVGTDAPNSTLTCGRRFDVVIADGLPFLPYGCEELFLARYMPTSLRFIFTGTPGQDRGLFHDLWTNNGSYHKAMLTWYTPLYPSSAFRLENGKEMLTNFGTQRFRNQFLCEFRKSSDE